MSSRSPSPCSGNSMRANNLGSRPLFTTIFGGRKRLVKAQIQLTERMRIQTVEGLRAGEYNDAKKLKLVSCGLTEFPEEIFDLADSLEILDLSSNPLSQLPENLHQLRNLKVAFFSDCRFATFPIQLAKCSSLEMIAFRGNAMTTIPEGAFPPKLRWLILTNNIIRALPRSIGQCNRLQKVMLAGNLLTGMPDEIINCKRLGLLRLSANKIIELPSWLFNMPQLAFLSFAGNPCVSTSEDKELVLDEIDWLALAVHEVLGEGASGVISKGTWRTAEEQERSVAIKVFKGNVTSDGSPADELNACITAGSHPNLIDPIGKILGHPERRPGLVLELIPPHYSNLGLPPTLQSCTRDSFTSGTLFSGAQCMSILRSIAAAAAHLHTRGIAHGDLYAHNVLIDDAGHALLGDFGAATVYEQNCVYGESFQRLEVLAFGHLIEDLQGLIDNETLDAEGEFWDLLRTLHRWCTAAIVLDRPSFSTICQILQDFRGL